MKKHLKKHEKNDAKTWKTFKNHDKKKHEKPEKKHEKNHAKTWKT